jgi:hypothetical protein
VTRWRISPARNAAITFSRFSAARSEDSMAAGSPCPPGT